MQQKSSSPAPSLWQSVIKLSNPAQFQALVSAILTPLCVLTSLMLLTGFTWVFLKVPDDYVQGAAIKIMYLHVPCAWLSMMIYAVMAGNSLGVLVYRHPLAEAAQKAAAPLGASFTFLCLVTGSLWGKPMWGTYWVWDARLTSEFILLLIYLGIIALGQAGSEPTRMARVTAVMVLVGLVNLPIIKFSVDWWNTLHQPASVLRMDGAHMDGAMLWPLLYLAIAFTLLFLCLYLASIRNEILRRKLRRYSLLASFESEHDEAATPAPAFHSFHEERAS